MIMMMMMVMVGFQVAAVERMVVEVAANGEGQTEAEEDGSWVEPSPDPT